MCHQQQDFWTPILNGLFGAMGVYIIIFLREKSLIYFDKRKILKWLIDNTEKGVEGKEWRTTRIIASHTDLTDDRVRYICSTHKKIRPSRKELEDRWGLKEMHGE